ncbi:Tripartite tricarboxylate transporter family receptor [Pigmentiphaga humi]|uniref:Tripartite tricarboxylate transporter family receptor n=1 Tax=Pigmentiphaga humi TaxID=2478468 RepID=A0A3P4B4C9_9BURK|nr:tripartite tricarboxylate transporter substrate binding protein [Pigmentiphaga humi]VCU70902.1 Tripartite tricarboxylate transporter family receptor [Pigmentiphaga humi]
MPITRTLISTLLCTAALSPMAALAATFPKEPVRIVVPFPAGGGIDIMARALSAELSPLWGQPVIVENVAGANSIIGAERVANASADGYTLMMTNPGTVVGNRFIYKQLPYDPDKSFTPITVVARSGQFIIANSATPFGNLQELVAAAKRSPGAISFSTPGNGSQEQLLMATLAHREGIELLDVPYKGIAPALTAVTGNAVQLTATSPSLAAPLIKQGRLKALAIAAERRSTSFPDVPTTAEAGMPYARSVIWYGLFGVAGTPEAVLQKIHNDVTRIVQRPDFIAKHMTSKELEPVANTSQDFAKFIRGEVAATADMVKAAGLQPE